ncbi:MAG: endonuclease domain-containing protein [Mesorhizobium sp.]
MSKLDRFKIRKARSLRSDTDAEQTLWDALARVSVDGTHFRRQVEIGPYRVDIGSLRLKLLIEVDGEVHNEPAQRERDRRRSRWLEAEGYRILRFTNFDVTTNMNDVLARIAAAVAERQSLTDMIAETHPTPALPRRPSPSMGG